MESIESYVYRDLKENEVLRVMLQGNKAFIYVKNVSRQVLQAYQPAWTPITDIDLLVISDLEMYKTNPANYNDFQEMKISPEQVVQFDLVSLD